MTSSQVAIHYHPEGYTTKGPKLMGRHVAGQSFLRGLFTHSRSTEFWSFVSDPSHGSEFAETAKAFGRLEKVSTIDRNTLSLLEAPGLLYDPGPKIGAPAWSRSFYGHNRWSICGITHTTSSAGAMDSIAELITAPVQPWDALICTSTAVKNNVEKILQAQINYLQDRLGITKFVAPQLPVIPLGIHTNDFQFTAEQRFESRRKLGADDNTLIVLYTGRLSFHAKAHPLAMYLALEQAARNMSSDKKVLLVECGWHANEVLASAFQEAVLQACPSVEHRYLDGRLEESRTIAWSCADVFCSFSDNIQESFGIVPLEAMAAALPCVVTDWDGYRDTVRDGIDGFRIPTVQAAGGLGTDLSIRHAIEVDSYDYYCGYASSFVAVDINAAASAFTTLFQLPELRKKMGQAGRERVQQHYDWRIVIQQYEYLWIELAKIRQASGKLNVASSSPPWPARMDPFDAFSAYPSSTLKPDTKISLNGLTPAVAMTVFDERYKLRMVNYANAVTPMREEVLSVIQRIGTGIIPAGVAVQECPESRQAFVFRGLVWLLKLGILKINAPVPG